MAPRQRYVYKLIRFVVVGVARKTRSLGQKLTRQVGLGGFFGVVSAYYYDDACVHAWEEEDLSGNNLGGPSWLRLCPPEAMNIPPSRRAEPSRAGMKRLFYSGEKSSVFKHVFVPKRAVLRACS